MIKQPTLAAKEPHLPTLLAGIRYPKLVSPKMDGIRAFMENQLPMSRSRHLIPNLYVQRVLAKAEYEGHDGELIVGNPWDYNVMQQTSSGTRSVQGEPDFKFYVFDNWLYKGDFQTRNRMVCNTVTPDGFIRHVPHELVRNEDELIEYENKCLERGYEGVMLRDPRAPYRDGRSTMIENYLIALKRFEDSEAIILSVNEGNTNTNEATKNPLGRTQRLGSGKNKIGRDTLGGFTCRWPETGAIFNVGMGKGLNDQLRAELWAIRDTLPGQHLKFSFLRVGMKNGVPRLPKFVCIRDDFDILKGEPKKQKRK